MTFYWSLRQLPELQDVPQRDRKLIWLKACWHGLFTWKPITLGAVLTLAMCVLLLPSPFIHRSGPVIALLALPLIVGIGGFLVRTLAMNAARPRLNELAEQYKESQHTATPGTTASD